MKRWLPISGTLIVVAAAMIAAACQERPTTSQSAAPQPAASPTTEKFASAGKDTTVQSASQEMELVGMLMRSGDAFMLITNSGDYSIADQPMTRDLDELVGRQVKVTATLVKGTVEQEGFHVIDVIQFSRID